MFVLMIWDNFILMFVTLVPLSTLIFSCLILAGVQVSQSVPDWLLRLAISVKI